MEKNMHQKHICQKLVVISIKFFPLFAYLYFQNFPFIFIIFGIRKKHVQKAAQWTTSYIKSVHNILRKKLTCLGNSKKTSQHISFQSYIHMCLSHANQMQWMVLFRSWSKQTNCQNIYKEVQKFEF